jgi:ABC-type multidrug transport system fused ATPase/permease subunit
MTGPDQPIEPAIKLLRRLWRCIAPRRRRQFAVLLVLMIMASFAEILSIGAVLPFLGVLTAPARVFEHPLAQPFVEALNIHRPEELLLPLTLIFGSVALLAGAMRLTLLWASTKLSFATGADLSIEIYHRTLFQPYSVHIARNSSEVINGISTKANGVIYNIMLPILYLISAGVMLVAILAALISIDPIIATLAFSGFGAIYFFIVKLVRRRLINAGQCIAFESTNVIRSLQEGLGGIRDVLVDGNQSAYCKIYQEADRPLREAQSSSHFIGQSPRYAMESLGIILIAALAYALAQETQGLSKAIPILGALALGAQRMLPVLQQAYNSWSNIQGGLGSLHDTIELLEQPLPHYSDQSKIEPIPFRNRIELKEISFRYTLNGPWVLNKLTLDIKCGSRVGFIGTTGSGKSTLLDIIMGLLLPTEGAIQIDDHSIDVWDQRAWQMHIAHVPQAIFLADSTIAENIAFGIPLEKIHIDRVRVAAEKAQIANDIEAWPLKYQTRVGERGIRLSGGQRQRIGIARALYKRADVIIFDEATSALDNETEDAVMKSIDGLGSDLTIMIIAHRLTTLRNCTQIVELRDGNIQRVGTYKELLVSC